MFNVSTKDWCEPNYAMFYNIAECWNTFSSLWICIISIVGMKKLIYHKNRVSVEQLILLGLVFANGILSALYHATLLRFAQFADELSMLLAAVLWNILLSLPRERQSMWFTKIEAAISLTITLLLFCIETELDKGYSRLWFTILLLVGMKRSHKVAVTFPNMYAHFRIAYFLWLFGGIAWMLDQLLCNTIGHWGGHAIWHIASGTGAYYLNMAIGEMPVIPI